MYMRERERERERERGEERKEEERERYMYIFIYTCLLDITAEQKKDRKKNKIHRCSQLLE